jgi:hypothetical protein
MAVQIFRSTDSGAPAYTPTAGSLIGILDYVLLNLAVPWTKTIWATNQVSYTQPAGTNGFTLQVDDTSTSVARLNAFESQSAFGVGVNQFPNPIQQQGSIGISDGLGSYCPKSLNPAPWRLLTNGNLFYFWSEFSTNADYYASFCFGDFISFKAGDLFSTIFSGVVNNGGSYKILTTTSGLTNLVSSGGFAFAPRRYTQLGGSTGLGTISDTTRGTSAQSGNSNVGSNPFPSLIDGSLNIAPYWITEPVVSNISNGVRGLLPGLWFSLHPQQFPNGYSFTVSSGLLAGRTFEAVGAAGGSYGQYFIETSNTWGGF